MAGGLTTWLLVRASSRVVCVASQTRWEQLGAERRAKKAAGCRTPVLLDSIQDETRQSGSTPNSRQHTRAAAQREAARIEEKRKRRARDRNISLRRRLRERAASHPQREQDTAYFLPARAPADHTPIPPYVNTGAGVDWKEGTGQATPLIARWSPIAELGYTLATAPAPVTPAY